MVGSDILIEFITSWHSLSSELEQFGLEIIEEPGFSDVATQLNIDQQLSGERSDGSAITPNYTGYTIRKKIEQGKEYRYPTLEDEGDYHDSFRIKVYGTKIEAISTDWKADMLDEKYSQPGAPIMGWSEESIQDIRIFMLPDFISFIRHYFKLV